MTVHELAQALHFNTFCMGDGAQEVSGGYAGDLLSWVMGGAQQGSAWLTIMSNANVAAVASLADVACVILAEKVQPDAALLERAQREELTIFGTELPLFEAAVAVGNVLG